jgi:hypothetical protein
VQENKVKYMHTGSKKIMNVRSVAKQEIKPHSYQQRAASLPRLAQFVLTSLAASVGERTINEPSSEVRGSSSNETLVLLSGQHTRKQHLNNK